MSLPVLRLGEAGGRITCSLSSRVLHKLILHKKRKRLDVLCRCCGPHLRKTKPRHVPIPPKAIFLFPRLHRHLFAGPSDRLLCAFLVGLRGWLRKFALAISDQGLFRGGMSTSNPPAIMGTDRESATSLLSPTLQAGRQSPTRRGKAGRRRFSRKHVILIGVVLALVVAAAVATAVILLKPASDSAADDTDDEPRSPVEPMESGVASAATLVPVTSEPVVTPEPTTPALPPTSDAPITSESPVAPSQPATTDAPIAPTQPATSDAPIVSETPVPPPQPTTVEPEVRYITRFLALTQSRGNVLIRHAHHPSHSSRPQSGSGSVPWVRALRAVL